MNIGVIIPTWNLEDKLEKCLHHLVINMNEQPISSGHNIYPVVVDNGSDNQGHETYQICKKFGILDAGMYMRLPWNTGFGGASDRGIHVCGEVDVFLFLNNDCYIDKGCLQAMIDAIMKRKGWIIGARLRYPDGTIQHAGGDIIGNWGALSHIDRGVPNEDPGVMVSREVPWVTGACMMVHAETFVRVGGFQEQVYQNGYEDVDLCLTFKLQDKPIYYCAEATGVHEEAQTPGRKKYENTNYRRFFAKWGPHDVLKFLPDGWRA